jgi:hypothetical protein
VRIAAQVLQIAQLAKYRTARRVAQGLPQLIERGDFMPIKKVLEGLQVIFWRFHNEYISPFRRGCQGQYTHYEETADPLQLMIKNHFKALTQAFILKQLALSNVNL